MSQNNSKWSRRQFIQKSATMAAMVSATGLVSPFQSFASEKAEQNILRRKLGKTGLEPTILAFGGGSQFLRNPNGEWEKVLEAAIVGGINFFDTAPSYSAASFNQGGSKSMDSEERFGEILPKYRNSIIISTKVESRDPELVKSGLEASLKKLKTDHVDILLIHGILPEDSTLDIENGVYKKLLELKASGMVKNIGFSSMDSAERSKELLEKLDFDVVLLAMNATKYGNFSNIALPTAIRKNTGVIAMKALRDIVGKDATANELLQYNWTMKGVSTVVVGHFGLPGLQQNIQLARAFSKNKTSSLNRNEFEMRMSGHAGPHSLCWARPGYADNGMHFS